jgi:hypothetical protein
LRFTCASAPANLRTAFSELIELGKISSKPWNQRRAQPFQFRKARYSASVFTWETTHDCRDNNIDRIGHNFTRWLQWIWWRPLLWNGLLRRRRPGFGHRYFVDFGFAWQDLGPKPRCSRFDRCSVTSSGETAAAAAIRPGEEPPGRSLFSAAPYLL